MTGQLPLFPELTAQFPSTRYQGSKAKLANWIWEHLRDLDFQTCLDAFGGTGAVAYRFKQEGKSVTYNDLLRFNYYIGKALIENDRTRLTEDTIQRLLAKHNDVDYPDFVQRTFEEIYFTDDENAWIDRVVTNIRCLTNPYEFALGFFALCQACIVKRPYNLFHRKNLYLRFAKVKRTFGNKASWDKPFDDWFRFFVDEANQAVFDNFQKNAAFNDDACVVPGQYDLVYIDPPYISRRGVATDYRDFYHFLEGLSQYDEWHSQVDHRSRHRRLKRQNSDWTDKNHITDAFQELFAHFEDSIIVVSYRNDGIPTEAALVQLLKRYKRQVEVYHYGRYQYALSTNTKSGELLLIGTD